MTFDFRITKVRLPVSLIMLGGEELGGEMFVQSISATRHGREEIPDILNSDEPFFPLARAGGTLLVAKDQVREVVISGDQFADPFLQTAARAEPVELTLTDGSVRTGKVFLEMPTARPRLLDFLNRYAQRFVMLYAAGGVCLVNRTLIEHVRPVEE
jgi:hypothetical protein